MFSPAARAWNAIGHETVALIAWDQMSPAVRTKIVDTLDWHPRLEKDLQPPTGPSRDRYIFAVAATWPDYVRGTFDPLNRFEHHPQWHYFDVPIDIGGVHGPVPNPVWDGRTSPQNLLQAMQKVQAQVVATSTPPMRRAIDLCWIEHLAGDAHQPLHAVSLYSPDYPTGDKGGNERLITTSWSNHANLHSLWDGLEGQGFAVDRSLKVAERIEREHPPTQFTAQARDLVPADWIKQSHDLAISEAYLNGALPGIPRNQLGEGQDAPPLPAGYERRAREVADRQIALAGYRLANLLTKLAAEMPTPPPAPAGEPKFIEDPMPLPGAMAAPAPTTMPVTTR